MKKIFYTLSAAVLVLGACTKEVVQPESSVCYPEGKVRVSVDVMYPDLTLDTRAMGQDPTIESLYVAVFGSEGSFQNWIRADFDKIVGYQDHTTTARYNVYLPISDKKRRVHFIANPPKNAEGEVITPVFGDEDEVINAMVKTKGSDPAEPEDAYWQKVELDHVGALNDDPDIQDLFYTPDTYTQEKLATVCLVRNYAKVLVTVGENQPYVLLDYQLLNVPEKGSVAPWNTGTRQYEPEYMDIYRYAVEGAADATKKGVFYTQLTRHYLGYMPEADAIDMDLPAENLVVDLTEGKPNTGAYMYERTMFTRVSKPKSQTCFIAHVMFTEPTQVSDNTWIYPEEKYYYKIPIVGKSGEYIPILRNIQYSISITGINEKGKGSAQDAADGDFAGDVSTGLAISSLNELSDGRSMIRVNQTEYTSSGLKDDTNHNGVIDDGDTVPEYTIYWQYFPTSSVANNSPVTTIGEGTTSDNREYDVTVTMYDVSPESAIACNLEDLLTRCGEETLSTGKWGTIKVPIAERGTSTKKTSVIRISGTLGTTRIYREVIINVIPETHFLDKNKDQYTGPAAELTPEYGGTFVEADMTDGLEKTVKIHFRIPKDLGASMFPLNVTIEAKNNNLYATSQDLPVSTGKSYWTDDKDNTFYFIYQIPLSEYRWIENGEYKYKQDYVCTLYTSKEAGNSTDIVLRDEKGYFAPCELSLKTVTLSVDKEEQTVYGNASEAVVNITSNVDWSIDWEDSELTDVSPSSFTVEGTNPVTTAVTFTFAPNTTNASNVYEVNLVGTVDGQPVVTVPLKITQLRKPTVSVNPDAGTSYTGYVWKESTVNPDSSLYDAYESDDLPNSSIATMSVTISGLSEYTFYIRSYGERYYDYVVVRQTALTSWSNQTTNAIGYDTGSHSGEELNDYTPIRLTGLDPTQSYTYYIQYGKDYSTTDGNDKGYVLIPKL